MSNGEYNNTIENVIYDELIDYNYDIESYKNFFSMIATNADDENDEHIFVKFKDYDKYGNLDDLREFLDDKQKRLNGHNNFFYDRMMLLAIQKYKNIDEFALGRLTRKIIETEREDKPDVIKGYYDLAYPKKTTWAYSRDTMQVTRVNRNLVSLKHAAVILHHNRLQDLPIEPNATIRPEDVDLLIDYNRNDTAIQTKLTRTLKPLYKLREFVTEKFETDVLSANDTKIAKEILNNLVPKMTGIPLSEIKDLRSPRKTVWLGECISDRIQYETPEMNALLDHMKTIILYENEDDAPYIVADDSKYEFFGGADTIGLSGEKSGRNNFKLPKYVNSPNKHLAKILVKEHSTGKYLLKLDFAGVLWKLGVGGLHSESFGEILENDELYEHSELDFSSFYPMLQVVNGFFPEHFPQIEGVLVQLIKSRLEEKAKGKKGNKESALLAQSQKISINSSFGLLNSSFYWLYDPQAMISVTISGQLTLLDVVEKLMLDGHIVTGGNTDGVNVKSLRSESDKLETLRKSLAIRFGIALDRTEYRRLIIRDVNNYIAILRGKNGDDVKLKGVFGCLFTNATWLGYKEFFDMKLYNDHIQGIKPTDEDILRNKKIPNFAKGFRHPVVAIALYQFYVHDIPVEKTIHEHDSVYDFCISQKSDTKKFAPTLIGLDENGNYEERKLQKTNRVIVVHNGMSLVKIHKQGGRDSSILAGESVMLLNDVLSENPKDYPIKYEYYIKECYKIIDKISPSNDLEF